MGEEEWKVYWIQITKEENRNLISEEQFQQIKI